MGRSVGVRASVKGKRTPCLFTFEHLGSSKHMLKHRTHCKYTVILALTLAWGGIQKTCGQDLPFSASGKPIDLSLRMEVARAIDRGNEWLMKHQSDAGHWSDADHPAVTSLALVALQRDPVENHAGQKEPVLAKGYDYLRSCAQPDGGIYRIEMLQNYHTSVSMMAFLMRSHSEHEDILRRARQFVMRGQQDLGEKGAIDNPLDGGIGYGTSYTHSDLSNTMHALEALYFSRHLAEDAGESADALNWEAALHFLQQCQQLPDQNKGEWVSKKLEDRGGFVYFPGNSKAGEHPEEDGVVALRSYGSISYAGMLSYIYADLDPSDIRVEAVLDWLNRHFTLEENPGMGAQGLFFYYHTMTKALTLARVNQIGPEPSSKHDWRHELALKLLDFQQGDGSWKNDNARWWEDDPALATSYALLTLEIIYQGL